MNGLYLAASGAAAQLSGLEVTTNNLSNLNTPGYRRFLTVLESVSGRLSPYQYAAAGPGSRIDMSQGPLQATGNPLDVAITGPAFLVVQTPQGKAYTRNGELQIAPDGTLLAAGKTVLDDSGAPITPPAGTLSIATDGSMSVNGARVATIAMADPAGTLMVPVGGSLYRPANGETLAASSGASQLHQGFIERPTGGEIGGMVSMLDAMRNYEGSMNAVRMIDQSQNQAIQAFTLQA